MSMFHKRKLTLGLIGGGVILIVIAAALMKMGRSGALSGLLGFIGLCMAVAGGAVASYGLRCPNCKSRVNHDWRVTECPKCGHPLD